jgi:hypothetical protein
MPSFHKNLCSGRDFLWHTMAPKGRSGGVLLGVDLQVVDIGVIDEGDFYVKFHLCNKSDSFKWVLIAVYGPAQDDQKEMFLAELVSMCSHENLPILMGDDFNILRHSAEKIMTDLIINGHFFNATIDELNLCEIEMSGRKYTWVNNRSSPTYEKLDRVLAATEWEEKYLLTTVKALPRVISDHVPLLLNSGETSTRASKPLFKFEFGWLLRDGFIDMLREIWSNYSGGYSYRTVARKNSTDKTTSQGMSKKI